MRESVLKGAIALADVATYLPAEDLESLVQLKRRLELRDNSPNLDELEAINALYEEAIIVRNKGLANELRRLAVLYEAAPHLRKGLIALQSSRSNAQHLPQQLRSRALKLDKIIPSL